MEFLTEKKCKHLSHIHSLQKVKLQEKGSQSREVNSLDGKHLDRQAIIQQSQDRYDDQRIGKHDCNEGPDDLKLIAYFQGQANLDTGKVAGYYYNTHAKVTFENPLSTQAPAMKKVN